MKARNLSSFKVEVDQFMKRCYEVAISDRKRQDLMAQEVHTLNMGSNNGHKTIFFSKTLWYRSEDISHSGELDLF